MKPSVFALLGAVFAAFSFTACSTADYNRIPHTPLISHYKAMDQSFVPYSSYWVTPDMTMDDWERYAQQSHTIYLKPVTLLHTPPQHEAV